MSRPDIPHPACGDCPLFLTSVEISGFKSFARPTRIDLPPGITALVGPNGSGKSNAVDAVRWALGEQSLRDLRSRRSEDVIHAGPRRSLGAAEVALTFSSDDEVVPDPWSQLSIARRLYRSGESEYLVNRQRSRLRDMVSTLHEAGVDAGGYIIVTQGMADSLLSATATERRGLLEQAAGLAVYRDRCNDAEHKLTTIARNVELAEVVLAELEPRVKLLRRQAKAFEDREDAGNRLREALKAWYANRRGEQLAGLRDAMVEADAFAARRRSAAAELEALDERASSSIERERAWHLELESATAAFHVAQRERDALGHENERLQASVAVEKQAAAEATDRRSRIEAALAESRARLASHEEELRSRQVELETASSEVERLHRERKPLEQAVTRAKAELVRRRSEVAASERAVSELALEASSARHELRETQVRLDALKSRVIANVDAVAEAAVRLRESREAEELIDAEHGEIAARVGDLQDDVVMRTQRLDRLQRILGRLLSLRTLADSDLKALNHAIDRLKVELDQGPVPALRVAHGWERAVASAIGHWGLANTWIRSSDRPYRWDVEGFERWRKTLERSLAEPIQWGDQIASGIPNTGANPLSATVFASSDEEAARLWTRLRGLPAHLICSPPVQVASREGCVWDAVGTRGASEHEPSVRYLLAKRRRDALARRAKNLVMLTDRIEAAADAAKLAVNSSAANLRESESQTSDIRARRQMIEETARRLERSWRDLEEERERDEARILVLTEELKAARGRIDELRAHDHVARKKLRLLIDEAEAAESEIRRVEARLTEISPALTDAENQKAVSNARVAAQLDLVRISARDVAHAESDLQHETTRETQRGDATQRLEDALAHATRRLADLDSCLADQRIEVERIRAKRPAVDDIAALIRAARQRLSMQISEHERCLARLALVTDDLRKTDDDARRELELEPRLLGDPPSRVPTDEELRLLRAKATAFADADEAVVGEYREMSERHRSLAAHIADLCSAKEDLARIIDAADREVRNRFGALFRDVNDAFSRSFRTMLRGGDACLEVTDDGGVEVRAQLPGRRAHSSSAFSGGERALVASSLLFAILTVRPSPFCILDEVDAALDESNVDRYLSVLRELSRQTQIIVVTHNRATMAAADVLYGMTMDDEGVSSLLSLKLESYAAG